MEISADGLTDVGNVRRENEDAFLVRIDLPLFVVADGVGGSAAGEVASGLFVAHCAYEFESTRGSVQDPTLLVKRCFHNGNKKILDYTEIDSQTKGMACTAEVLSFDTERYYLGHIGDSRTYLLRDGSLELLTKDHSYVQEQIDLGLITSEEADKHRLRNAIYRAVGFEPEIQVDLLQGRVKDRDLFLMCSDGLSDMVPDEQLFDILRTSETLDARVQQLIHAAKVAGGRDNITAVVCEARIQPQSLTQKLTALLGLGET